MSTHYVLSGQIQEYLTAVYQSTGMKKDFCQALRYLKHNGQAKPMAEASFVPSSNFKKALESIVIPLSPEPAEGIGNVVKESIFFPEGKDVVVYRQFAHIKDICVKQECMEMVYTYQGSCALHFEGETRILREGEFSMIAPLSLRNIIVENDDAIVFRLMLRNHALKTAFADLLSEENLLWQFVRHMLRGNPTPDHLIIPIENREEINDIIRRFVLESSRLDQFSNRCSLQYMHLLFTALLRSCTTGKHEDARIRPNANEETSFVLQYIQAHFQNLTLAQLAEYFHYSESHMSRMVKKNTGRTFTCILSELKAKAVYDYVAYTDHSLTQIADMVGYESVDHLSRMFKKRYGLSPQHYRDENARKKARKVVTTAWHNMAGSGAAGYTEINQPFLSQY